MATVTRHQKHDSTSARDYRRVPFGKIEPISRQQAGLPLELGMEHGDCFSGTEQPQLVLVVYRG